MDFWIPERKTVIEVQGPHHYIAPERILSLTSEAKLRVLKKQGQKVIEIPFFCNQVDEKGSPKLEELID